MNRCLVVESARAALKGGFSDTSRGFVRVFGLAKLTVPFGFVVAADNVDRIRSFRAKHNSNHQLLHGARNVTLASEVKSSKSNLATSRSAPRVHPAERIAW